MTIVAVLALLLLGRAEPSFALVDDADGQLMLCRPLSQGERFVLAYTNSMYGGDVRETYQVTWHGTLRRVAMHAAHPAAADYYAFTADVIRDGELYRIDVPPAEFSEVAVRVDRVGAPRLIFADGELDLLIAAGNQQRVLLAGRAVGDECP